MSLSSLDETIKILDLIDVRLVVFVPPVDIEFDVVPEELVLLELALVVVFIADAVVVEIGQFQIKHSIRIRRG